MGVERLGSPGSSYLSLMYEGVLGQLDLLKALFYILSSLMLYRYMFD
jgi:hypothetical protein